MTTRTLVAVFALATVGVVAAPTVSVGLQPEHLREGLAAFRAGEMLDAAALWLVDGKLGRSQFAPGTDPYPLLLAVVALERADSPLAFETWMHARSLLRRRGERWEDLQSRLASSEDAAPFDRVAREIGLAGFEGPSRIDEVADWWRVAERPDEGSLQDLVRQGGRLARSQKWSTAALAAPADPPALTVDARLDHWVAALEGATAVAESPVAFSAEGLRLLPTDHWLDVAALEPLSAVPERSVWSYDLGGVGLAALDVARTSPPSSRPPRPSTPVPRREDLRMRPDTATYERAALEIEADEGTLRLARIAWTYFEKNERATGLVNSVDGYPMLTLWDLASQIAAWVSANQLGLLSDADLKGRFDRLFTTLEQLPFYQDELPNREYDASTGKKTASGKLPKEGSGWSALDLGRLLIWLRIVHDWYPERQLAVQSFVDRMDLTRLVIREQMFGVLRTRREQLRQEGRFPYEQYAAAGFRSWGIELAKASGYEQTLRTSVEGVELRHDQRPLSYLTSDPLALGVVELGGVDDVFAEEAIRLYEAQRARWLRTDTLTAVNEDSIDRSPWFAYNSAFALGESWITLSHSGKRMRSAMALSTKAAFLWSAIRDDDYSDELRAVASELFDSRKGFAAGRYDTGKTNHSYNVNTNAIVLEALLYEARGRRPFLVRASGPRTGSAGGEE